MSDEPVWTRSWYGYSKEKLREKLSGEDWSSDCNQEQDLYNWLVNKLVTITDELAPLTKRKCINTSSYYVKSNTNLINKHRKLVSRWKKHGDVKCRDQANIIKKELWKRLQSTRKDKIRRHIQNGNSKTLWDAVKVARDENTSNVPRKILWDDKVFKDSEIAEAFSEYFEDKVEKIVQETGTKQDSYNGRRLFDEDDEDFMRPSDIMKVLKNLKIKNCEGYDRLPLRIIAKGAELLLPIITKLFSKIYKERMVPNQWKVAKVIPLHKKGDNEHISNYRPISNLCPLSKIFEKLVLRRLWNIADKHRVNLTGETQHGFKPNRSTITAALTIQSIISRALNDDKYVVAASLDLSAAFDVVDRCLLFKRIKVMGIPKDVTDLLRDWLSNRQSYVEIGGNSSYMKESNSGTVQGSVLGPVLFSIFI
jgi:hypothetical protein